MPSIRELTSHHDPVLSRSDISTSTSYELYYVTSLFYATHIHRGSAGCQLNESELFYLDVDNSTDIHAYTRKQFQL